MYQPILQYTDMFQLNEAIYEWKKIFFSVLRRIYSPLYLDRKVKFHNLGQTAFPFCSNAKKIRNEKSLANFSIFHTMNRQNKYTNQLYFSLKQQNLKYLRTCND